MQSTISSSVTLVGNLVEEPTLRFTQNGTAVASFRVAVNERYQDRQTGEWKDGTTTFLTVNAWRQLAENVAEILHKSDQVIVTGTLRQRPWETEAGEKRSSYEIEADAIGLAGIRHRHRPQAHPRPAHQRQGHAGRAAARLTFRAGSPEGPKPAPGRPAWDRPHGGRIGRGVGGVSDLAVTIGRCPR